MANVINHFSQNPLRFLRVFASLRLILFLYVAALCFGCVQTVDPSFPTTIPVASADIDRMGASKKPLERPLVIISGFLDPGFNAFIVGNEMRAVTNDDRIVGVEMGTAFGFDECRRRVIDAVEKRFPSSEPTQTIEVDVIGLSMGGVVARYAALPLDVKGKHLHIARLFTVSSPLQGAYGADNYPPLHPLMYPMRRGSPVLISNNSAAPKYAVYSYVRLYDHPVGAANTSIPGRRPWWVATPWFNDPHNGAWFDPRIWADIGRRLRDEQPLTSEPPTPLP